MQLIEVAAVITACLLGDESAPRLGGVGGRMAVVAQDGTQSQVAALASKQLDRSADLRRFTEPAASLARLELEADLQRQRPAGGRRSRAISWRMFIELAINVSVWGR